MEKPVFDWEKRLPNYLTWPEKDRLKRALEQFLLNEAGKKSKIQYSNFYLSRPQDFIYQGDLFHSVSLPFWDSKTKTFETDFSPAILLSNSCDASPGNERNIPKQVVFAPIIPFSEFEIDVRQGRSKEKVESILNQVRNQLVSNLLFLPNPKNQEDGFIAFFDKAFSLPTNAIPSLFSDLKKERYLTLDNFGSYLLIVKLSFHFCRVPEEVERRA